MTVAVVFSSTRTSSDTDAYEAMAADMERLAVVQDGYVGHDSVRDPGTGQGITVSYWRDESSARAWKQVAEHRAAQHLGRERWYSEYRVVVTEVLREYRGP